MPQLDITFVNAIPDYSTSNREGTVNFANTTVNLYSSLTSPNSEGNSGTASAKCCTLQLTKNKKLPISVSGVCADLASTLKGGFVLQALWNNQVFFTTDVKGIPSPGAPAFLIPPGTLDWVQQPPPFPCRLGGTWTWTVGPPGGTVTARSQDMLLEIIFVWSGPPRGPISPPPPPPNALARPDFGNVYPVDLFRLFLPSPSEFPPSSVPLLPWYLKRVVDKVWNLGLTVNTNTAGTRTIQYEAIQGQCGYITGGEGGVFQLSRFMKTFFGTVNCYDLAGIVQLAIAMIQNPNGTETFDSRWIFCRNFGYINPGPLIGWPQYPDCNSPFFAKGLPHYNEPPQSPDRQGFGFHAWIEVSPNPAYPARRTVLDATHCLQATPNSPCDGTQERTPYLQAQIDQARGKFQQLFDYNPATRTDQIGVTTIGILPNFVMEFPVSGVFANAELPNLVNNAPCDAATLSALIKHTLGSAEISDTDVTVGSAGCQVLLNVSAADTFHGLLHIDVSSFESPVDAMSTFAGRKAFLEKIICIEDRHVVQSLGNEAIRAPLIILWRRNCVVSRVFVSPDPGTNLEGIEAMLATISHSIDDHLKGNAVTPGLERRPSPALRESHKVVATVSSMITLHLDELAEAHEVLVPEVDDRSILLPSGLGKEDGTFDFYAVAKGRTKARLCAAHAKSLAVHVTEVDVIVQ
ncbi:hypothetical protein NA57DRAFT_79865 [Rhizodiscina lignyota]|uniref:Uncharacterized protein n=1 Tax=Rhizodiscina lignyota TaxID=1504668 RepID=A0A9P4M2I9_9PEZI|nr:hypothetical protein NA57DRAFT_79865 [Rhizodiscina lignyota]